MKINLPADFVPEIYLKLNPDVAAAGVNPVEHYLTHGLSEGRAYRRLNPSEFPSDFDPSAYLAANPDLEAAGVDPIEHFSLFGYREGRSMRPTMAAELKPKLRGKYDSDGLTSLHNHDFMLDHSFNEAYQRGVQASGVDYKWHWRVHMGLWAARAAVRVSGDFIECGVNRGFLSSAIMKLLNWDSTRKTFFLLDTFNGLDPRFVSDAEKAAGVLERNSRELESGFYVSSAKAAIENFSEWKNVKIIEGPIPETLAHITADKIAFAHIDLNCSPPEVAAIDFIWKKMPVGGVVLLDDYAYFGYQPQKEGMDIWAKKRNVPIASLPTGQGLIVKA